MLFCIIIHCENEQDILESLDEPPTDKRLRSLVRSSLRGNVIKRIEKKKIFFLFGDTIDRTTTRDWRKSKPPLMNPPLEMDYDYFIDVLKTNNWIHIDGVGLRRKIWPKFSLYNDPEAASKLQKYLCTAPNASHPKTENKQTDEQTHSKAAVQFTYASKVKAASRVENKTSDTLVHRHSPPLFYKFTNVNFDDPQYRLDETDCKTLVAFLVEAHPIAEIGRFRFAETLKKTVPVTRKEKKMKHTHTQPQLQSQSNIVRVEVDLRIFKRAMDRNCTITTFKVNIDI